MIKDGSTFAYKGEPVGDGAWWSTTTYTSTNCILEETNVEKACPTCPTTTVWGILTVEPEREYVEHNHMMYIWNYTEHIGSHRAKWLSTGDPITFATQIPAQATNESVIVRSS